MKQLVSYIELLLGTSGVTFKTDLEKLGEELMGDDFGGVFALNEERPKKEHCIVNTDNLGEPGSHWFAVCPNGYIYDPLKKNGIKNDKEQADTEKNCGARALAFCVFHWLDRESAELI